MTARPAPLSPQFEPHETPPAPLALGLGLQSAMLSVTPIVLFPIVLVQAVGGDDSQKAWAVFAMLAVNGATIMLQALRVGPFGSGLIVVTIPSSIAIPFCVIALEEGGPSTLAALVVVSALFQIAVSMRLSLLRRIVTPSVSGTIIILLFITVMAVVFGSINEVPDGAAAAAGPVCLAVTFAVIVVLLLRGAGQWRVWGPLIGIGAGWIAAGAFGIYDFGPVNEVPSAGLPLGGWPGLGFEFGLVFWSLLPAFLFVSVILVLQANSLGLSTQMVSWRNPRAMDYRRVQGGAACTGIGSILAGLVGAIPITVAPRGALFVQQTGCASRNIGLLTGAILLVVAFFPKSWGLLLGLPGPVTATFLIVITGPLLIEGMKLILRDAPDYRRSLIVGVSITIGLGFQFELVTLPVGGLWESMFQNGLTAGGVTVVVLTFVNEFSGRARHRTRAELSSEALPRINEFLEGFASSHGWGDSMTRRMQAAAEETLLILGHQDERGTVGEAPGQGDGIRRQLLISAYNSGGVAELEFVSAPADGAGNLEDRIALLTEPGAETPEMELPDLESTVDRDASLRLLLHYASSVSHRQYHETEVITVRITPPARE